VPFSKQFRALGRITALFAGVWAAGGALLGVIAGPSMTGDPAFIAAAGFAVMYGMVGAIAGATTALLIARAEAGHQVGDIPKRRLTMWGVAGGIAPAALFAALGFVVGGASASQLLPLVGLGVLSGGLGGFVSGAAAASVSDGQPRGRSFNEIS
jgi:hypothetical protein